MFRSPIQKFAHYLPAYETSEHLCHNPGSPITTCHGPSLSTCIDMAAKSIPSIVHISRAGLKSSSHKGRTGSFESSLTLVWCLPAFVE